MSDSPEVATVPSRAPEVDGWGDRTMSGDSPDPSGTAAEAFIGAWALPATTGDQLTAA